jgi:FSR family fosmidomycin resistance protein-like MFS transporter
MANWYSPSSASFSSTVDRLSIPRPLKERYVAVTASTEQPVASAKREERRAIGVACGAHALHDGFTDLIWLALPIWQAEFGLSYAAVGLLRTVFSGTMATLQIPSSLLAERIGVAAVLAAGTALAGLCYVLAGASAGFLLLMAALVLGGLGASTQHPLASALVARAFAGPRSITALGTYNFAGDIGKMALPAAATALLLVMPWRPAYALLGCIGIAAGFVIFVLTPRFGAETEIAAAAHDTAGARAATGFKRGYFLLLAIGAIDNATRAGFLVFLPFLLIAKGGSVTVAGFALTLVFIGGAGGKLACAWIAARFGVIGTIIITQGLTAAGMLGVLLLPLLPSVILLPFFGIALNGTSSATYGSIPDFAVLGGRDRAFSWFYTGTLGAGALAPTAAGLAGDFVGATAAVAIVALLVLLTLPLAWALRPALQAARAA